MEIAGKTDFDIFDAKHAQQAFNDEQEIMKTGQPKIAYEEKETWTDGSESWLLSTKVAIQDSNKRTIGLSGVSFDISKLKTAEQQLINTNDELQKINVQLSKALIKAEKNSELEKKNKELLDKETKLQEAHDTINQKKMLLELLNQELTESNTESRRLNEEFQKNNEILLSQNAVGSIGKNGIHRYFSLRDCS